MGVRNGRAGGCPVRKVSAPPGPDGVRGVVKAVNELVVCEVWTEFVLLLCRCACLPPVVATILVVGSGV